MNQNKREADTSSNSDRDAKVNDDRDAKVNDNNVLGSPEKQLEMGDDRNKKSPSRIKNPDRGFEEY